MICLDIVRKHPTFMAGLLIGASLVVGGGIYGATKIAPDPKNWWTNVSSIVGERDALPGKKYLWLTDSTEPPDRRVAVRELTLHGSQDLSGTYKNLWNNNTGRVKGFISDGVIQLVFIEDPDPHGHRRRGIGAIKLELVPLDNAKDPKIYVGHEEGCDCAGNNTTSVPAVLSDTVEPPVWATSPVKERPTIPLHFARPEDVLKYRSSLAGLR